MVMLHHEAIDLGLGKRVGPLLLDRILRRQHHEGIVELERLVADGDLLLLHRFEERTLHFRRSAVDLIREDDIGEDRPLLDREFT